MPRLVEHVEVITGDERAEVVLEPGQVVDLLAHWKFVSIAKRTNEDKPRYEHSGDSALVIERVATTHPDVFIEFWCDVDHRPRVIGGPLVTQIELTKWIVPVRRMFHLVAHNRSSRETIRERVYMRVLTKARLW